MTNNDVISPSNTTDASTTSIFGRVKIACFIQIFPVVEHFVFSVSVLTHLRGLFETSLLVNWSPMSNLSQYPNPTMGQSR